jgi:hypothetical protein
MALLTHGNNIAEGFFYTLKKESSEFQIIENIQKNFKKIKPFADMPKFWHVLES